MTNKIKDSNSTSEKENDSYEMKNLLIKNKKEIIYKKNLIANIVNSKENYKNDGNISKFSKNPLVSFNEKLFSRKSQDLAKHTLNNYNENGDKYIKINDKKKYILNEWYNNKKTNIYKKTVNVCEGENVHKNKLYETKSHYEEERSAANTLLQLKNHRLNYVSKSIDGKEKSLSVPVMKTEEAPLKSKGPFIEDSDIHSEFINHQNSDNLSQVRLDIINIIRKIDSVDPSVLRMSARKEIEKVLENINLFIWRKSQINSNKLNELQKRRNHVDSERLRRNAINIGIRALASILPDCSNKSKKCVIYEAIKYILIFLPLKKQE